MSYSFMTIQKVKSFGGLTSKYNHNCRQVEIDNVDSSKIELNDNIIPLPEVDGKEQTYRQAFLDRISSLDYYQEHEIRKNAVLGFEIVMTYSADENVDVEEWKRKSAQWLKDTFDVAPDGRSNVLHAVCHEDEPGNRHIHALVVPIDERGRLNAKRFTDGARAMSMLQSSYAKSVEDLGLERGIAGSSAKHKDIRKMYAELNRAIDIPNPNPYETALEFRQRVLDELQTRAAVQEKELKDQERRFRRKLDEERIAQRKAIEEEYQKTIFMAKHEAEVINKSLREENETLTSENVRLKSEHDKVSGEYKDIVSKIDDAKLELSISETERKFIEDAYFMEEVMSYTQSSNPELAHRIEVDREAAELAYREYLERAEQIDYSDSYNDIL